MDNNQTEAQGAERITQLENALVESQSLVGEGHMFNHKLATCLKLFVEIHFTKQEKIKIANEIDSAPNVSEVDKICKFYLSQNRVSAEGSEEYVLSPAFISNLTKYYKSFKGINPLEEIERRLNTLEQYFFALSQLEAETDQTRIDFYKNIIDTKQEECLEVIAEIKRIAEENK